MILLRDLLAPWFHYAGVEAIEHMHLDSRDIQQGDLFVALPGHAADGREYIVPAFSSGAVAALVHTDNPEHHGKVTQDINTGNGLVIEFFQLNRQLSAVAAQAYPLKRLLHGEHLTQVIGITGTNGKTSVSQLIAQLVTLAQRKAAVMGTLGNGVWGALLDTGNTTADAITLMRQLHSFEQDKVDVCAMEVSSHGLVQGRVEAVPFDVGVFTNLSRDHLDYHGDMDAYGAAKKRIFTISQLKYGLLNLDDAVGQAWFDDLKLQTHLQCLGFSTQANTEAKLYCTENQFHHHGVTAELHWPQGTAELHSPLLGEFNLSNLLAAMGSLYLLGFDMGELVSLVPQLTPVPGRMERFTTNSDVTLVVDYAHTPDALEQALKALRSHCHGKLWCVFGCGGDRDKGKRPLMAQAAESHSDQIMVTSDNARFEDPQEIISDVIQGLSAPESALVEEDRIAAIKLVVAKAKAGDLILLAGKGHETYQEIAGKRIDYDERALALSLKGALS